MPSLSAIIGCRSWAQLVWLGAQPRHAGGAAFEMADHRHEGDGGLLQEPASPGEDRVDRLGVGLQHAEIVARRPAGPGLAGPLRETVEIAADAVARELVVENGRG